MVVDLFYRTPRIIRADEKILLRAHTASAAIERTQVGGLVLNHLGWARILGLKTGIFGKMGDDRNGEFLRDGMDRLGIRHHLSFDGTATAFATIFVDAHGDRAIYMARGATGELTPAEVRSRHGAFIRRANLVSTEISQLPLRTVLAILLFARTHSIPTILDVDVPPSDAIGSLGTRAELERALKLATFLKPSKAAAREIAGNGRDPLKIADAIRAKYGNRAVIITEGDKGCSIAARDVSIRVPAFKVKQVDSTGAGDAFLAGICAGLRLGLPWDKIGRLANAAGAVAVTRLGAFPSGFEVREEILELYAEPIALPTPRLDAEPREAAIGDSSGEVEKFFDLALTELAAMRAGLNLAAISRTVEIIRTALGRGGRVHVTGVGKPEHVARYAASVFCSVGTPATFLHATETLARQPRPGASARRCHRDFQQRQHRRIALDRDRHPRAGRAVDRHHRQQGLEPRATRRPRHPRPRPQRRRRPRPRPAHQRARRSLRPRRTVGSLGSCARPDGRRVLAMAPSRRNRRSGKTPGRIPNLQPPRLSFCPGLFARLAPSI